MISAAEPFSSRHRILDTAGEIHQVVVVGDRLCDETGAVIGTTGFYIDLTDSYRDEVNESVDEAVAELEQSRAVIEQAKGALMLVYGIPADRAFDVLVWRSQETNTRLRILAERIVAGSVSVRPVRVCAPSSIVCSSPPTKAPHARCRRPSRQGGRPDR